jgi:hypothetical protein
MANPVVLDSSHIQDWGSKKSNKGDAGSTAFSIITIIFILAFIAMVLYFIISAFMNLAKNNANGTRYCASDSFGVYDKNNKLIYCEPNSKLKISETIISTPTPTPVIIKQLSTTTPTPAIINVTPTPTIRSATVQTSLPPTPVPIQTSLLPTVAPTQTSLLPTVTPTQTSLLPTATPTQTSLLPPATTAPATTLSVTRPLLPEETRGWVDWSGRDIYGTDLRWFNNRPACHRWCEGDVMCSGYITDGLSGGNPSTVNNCWAKSFNPTIPSNVTVTGYRIAYIKPPPPPVPQTFPPGLDI